MTTLLWVLLVIGGFVAVVLGLFAQRGFEQGEHPGRVVGWWELMQ